MLSLSNILVLTPQQPQSCFHSFTKDYHQAAKSQFRIKEAYQVFPLLAREWCWSIDEVMISTDMFPKQRLRRMVRSFAGQADDLHSDIS